MVTLNQDRNGDPRKLLGAIGRELLQCLLVRPQGGARDGGGGDVPHDFHEVPEATLDGFCGLIRSASTTVFPQTSGSHNRQKAFWA